MPAARHSIRSSLKCPRLDVTVRGRPRPAVAIGPAVPSTKERPAGQGDRPAGRLGREEESLSVALRGVELAVQGADIGRAAGHGRGRPGVLAARREPPDDRIHGSDPSLRCGGLPSPSKTRGATVLFKKGRGTAETANLDGQLADRKDAGDRDHRGRHLGFDPADTQSGRHVFGLIGGPDSTGGTRGVEPQAAQGPACGPDRSAPRCGRTYSQAAHLPGSPDRRPQEERSRRGHRPGCPTRACCRSSIDEDCPGRLTGSFGAGIATAQTWSTREPDWAGAVLRPSPRSRILGR